jgi:plastocyanin
MPLRLGPDLDILWSADTDQDIVDLLANDAGGYAAKSTTIPANCYAVIISTNGTATGVFASPNSTDIDSGILIGKTTYEPLLINVEVGTQIWFHNPAASAINVNVVRFYNKS